MRVIILGSAAGGGVPQWNCACPNCQAARTSGPGRTQSSVAVTADDERWILLNASPDLRQQLATCRPLWPTGLRASPLRAMVLTDGEIDHSLGLLVLREAGTPLALYAPNDVLELLADEWPLLAVLDRYGGAYARALLDGVNIKLTDASGAGLGLTCTGIALARRPPRYARRGTACTMGLRIEDERTGAVLAYVPAAEAVSDAVRRLARGADLLCFDGTFWSEDELRGARSDATTASAMGHVPLGGRAGSLDALRGLGAARVVLVHVNNTNPILDRGSPERRAVEAAGVTVAEDGMEFVL
ncbi:MAG TPA: pyrroloquinoline quinone biosynthesis protein PqqB [Gemmatimonadales bacterium]|nr:pyrroloquinoline quinone biosynthesis protein PqqB [Gemmatimonadales bacterium]